MTREEILKIAKPILFNTEMVRAIIDGRKSETRRVVKGIESLNVYRVEPAEEHEEDLGLWEFSYGIYFEGIFADMYKQIKPRYKIGDYLYVRETWFYETHMHDITEGEPDLSSGRYLHRYVYRADSPEYPVDIGTGTCGWKPSIHMPKEAARIFLKVTNVRVERLQNIDDEGAKAEGANFRNGKNVGFEEKIRRSAVERFAEIWNSTIHKKDLDKYGWDVNPWVWVYQFERVEVD